MKRVNQKGISLVETVLAAGLLGLVIFLSTSATMHTSAITADKMESTDQVLLSVRTQIEQMIQNNYLWGLTAGLSSTSTPSAPNNIKLNCSNLATVTTCPITGPTPIPLVLVDSTNTTTQSYYQVGFTSIGQPCPVGQVYTPAALGGNDQCPFQYSLQYQIICPSAAATCFFPMVQISGSLSYSPHTKIGQGINVANYGIDNFIRGTSPSPTAHTYECFTVQFISSGVYGPGTVKTDPGNTWPPVTDPNPLVIATPPTTAVGNVLGKAIWGISCGPGWIARNCSISESTLGPLPDSDHWLDGAAGGCSSDNHGYPNSEWGSGAILSEACCRLR